jgi:hypothetical protein
MSSDDSGREKTSEVRDIQNWFHKSAERGAVGRFKSGVRNQRYLQGLVSRIPVVRCASVNLAKVRAFRNTIGSSMA